MLTVKISNHKIRSRNRKCRKRLHSFRMDVVARLDRCFDSLTILRLSTFFHADWLRFAMAVLKAIDFTRTSSTRTIRVTVTMMSILSQKNWLLVGQ